MISGISWYSRTRLSNAGSVLVGERMDRDETVLQPNRVAIGSKAVPL